MDNSNYSNPSYGDNIIILNRRLSSSAPILPLIRNKSENGMEYLVNEANFQQKQLQAKEQKLLSLYESHQDKFLQKLEDQTNSRSSSAENNPNLQMSSGKVRQLFEERRKLTKPANKVSQNGWDKSHPLKPIKKSNDAESKESLDSLNRLLASHNKNVVKNNTLHSPTKENNLNNNSIGNSIFGKLPNIGGELLSTQKPKENITKLYTTNSTKTSNIKNQINSLNKPMANIKISTAASTPKKTPTKVTAAAKPTAISSPTPQAPPRKRAEPTPPPRKTPIKIAPTVGAAITRKKSPPKRMPPPTDPNLAQCKQCGRNFAKDRIEAHERICSKTAKKKRKAFDPVKHRLKGTEAESYYSKKKPTTASTPPKSAKSNWRKKHEEFIANIRAAKQAQEFVKNGGNIRDLPPPPPLDTSDLIPCPHCGRKFNEAAAERHIPKCANMRHNKPAPARNTKPTFTGRR